MMSELVISFSSVQFSSVAQLCPALCDPWTAAYQASLFITNSQSLLKLTSIELVMPSNHLVLCHPLLLPPSIFPNIGVFSNESVLCIRWPKYWSFSFSISPSNEYSGLISFMVISFFLAAACPSHHTPIPSPYPALPRAICLSYHTVTHQMPTWLPPDTPHDTSTPLTLHSQELTPYMPSPSPSMPAGGGCCET